MRHRTLIAAVFLLALGWLLHVNLPTLHEDYLGEHMRVGVIPWSDAHAWNAGADRVLAGRELSGVPARRPLYPLFLSVLTALTGDSYLTTIWAQICLSAISIAAAAGLLFPLRGRAAAALFLGLLVVWRPSNVTLLMTETLAMPILALAFVSVWRGLERDEDTPLLAGFFLLGLSQAVRPWAILCMATAPIVGFFIPTPRFSARWRRSLLLFGFTAAGFGLHPLAGSLFSHPESRTTYSGEILYAQVSGSMNWNSTWKDPVIARLKASGASPEVLNRAIYRRCWEIFRDDPSKFGRATLEAWQHYRSRAFRAFPDGRLEVAAMALTALLFVAFSAPPPDSRSRWLAALVVLGFTLGLAFYSRTTADVALLFGVAVCAYRRRPWHVFLLLYALGTVLSIPFIGISGGVRLRVGADIVHFALVAVGLGAFIDRPSPIPEGRLSWSLRRPTVLWVPAAAFAVFIVAPFFLRVLTPKSPDIGFQPHHIAQALNEHPDAASHPSLQSSALQSVVLDDASPDLEGVRAYRRWTFHPRDALEFSAGEGLDTRWRSGQLWPLEKRPYDRTVLFVGRNFLILPGVTRQQLVDLLPSELLLFGTLEARDLGDRFDTPSALVADEIWYLAEEGRLQRWNLESPLS